MSVKAELVFPAVFWLTIAILIVLKAMGMVTLSWWWITCVFWVPIALSLAGVGFILAVGVVIIIISIIAMIVLTILDEIDKRR